MMISHARQEFAGNSRSVKQILCSLAVSALVLGCAGTSSASSEYLHGLGDTRYVALEAPQIGRSFHVFTRLPARYSEGDSDFPVIYLLDGGALYPMLSSYSQYLTFGEEMPASILVGISYGSTDFEGGNFRSTDYTAPSPERDYWGGAEKFQAFLAEELIPYIERTYRADPERRIIFGQSIGGQFVLYTALTRPGLFWGHIASNPALHRNLDWFLRDAAAPEAPSKLFVASGEFDDPRFRDPALRWIAHRRTVDRLPWEFHAIDLAGHSHMSAPPASFRAGLAWLFDINAVSD